MVAHTITGLKRWSCQNGELPPVSQVKALHVYDFDNTLFMSPLPNINLWTTQTIGFLQTQDCFANGGWWHDQHILRATGDGIEKEEPRAWNGWWNEQIVNLVELSMRQKDALTILLTGRGEHNFSDLIKKMVSSKKLDFDMICLKQQVGPVGQRFPSTMHYKQELLKEVIYTYREAEEIRIYEDRPKHVKGFREFLEFFNGNLLSSHISGTRKPIMAEVIQVADATTTLDPITETAEVQRMINFHNASLRAQNLPANAASDRLQLKRTVFFTGYLISPSDTANLVTLVTSSLSDSELRFLANNILITPRPAQKSILDKVGGLGAKQIWQVTGTAVFENKIWAARVTPIPSSASYYTDNPIPVIVLALRKNARPADASRIHNWQPVPSDKQMVFETVVGEKVQLRVEKEIDGEVEFDSLFASSEQRPFVGKRKQAHEDGDYGKRDGNRGYGDENRRQNHQNGSYRSSHQDQRRPNRQGNSGGGGGGNNHRNLSGRGGRGGNRGGGGGGSGGGRNRARGGYKSLDDVGNSPRYGQGNGYQNHQPNYDDPPSQNYSAGNDVYGAPFPALGSTGNNSGGGLPYGH